MDNKGSLKHKWIWLFTTIFVVCVLAITAFVKPKQTQAISLNNDGTDRKAVITAPYTTFEWWLLTWSNSQLVCQIYAEHEGLPDNSEIEYYCGQQVLNDWLRTSACVFNDEITNTADCPGLYLHLANVTPGERQIEVALMPATVYVDIADCNPQPPENRCETLPSLHLIAEEPLPNEQIINIQGYIGDEPFTCQGAECYVPLPTTGIGGVQAVFWADSTYGDSSKVFTAQIRIIPWGDFGAPDDVTIDQQQWYVDILSSQYLGDINSSCSEIWSAFPPIGGPPDWLSSPLYPDGLVSNQPYYYLAGSLISQGLVDAVSCPDGGMQANGAANQCGLEVSRELINNWQNQFNSEIIQVANDTGIPAQLMKNIFSRESQFWPGLSASYKEAGLGHLSDLGADTVLLWNPSFFSQFCPLVLDTTVCQSGFGNLDIEDQEMLRGALVQKVNAACPECPDGIDLSKANFSISIFARSLLASCEQVGQIVYNQTGRMAGEVSLYEDLWKFTLVNYNAGPGCLSNAIQQAISSNYPLTWDSIQLFLEPGGCQASIDYVDDITYMPLTTQNAVSTDTLQVTATPTPTPQTTPTLQVTPTPTEYNPPSQTTPTQAYP